MLQFLPSPARLLLLAAAVGLCNAAAKLTPESMLAAPRRGTALPNPAGTLALYTTSTYNFTTHGRKYGLWVMDLKDGSSTLFSNSSAVGEAFWFGGGNNIMWLEGEDDGTTSLYVGDATKPAATPIEAGSIPGSPSGFKTVELANGTTAIAFAAPTNPNGTLFNSVLEETPISSGRLYTSLFVRHWDTYITPVRSSIWYTTIVASTANGTTKYTLNEPINALNGTGLESPVVQVGGTDHYDISKYGLVAISKDITLNPAITTKSDIHYIPLITFREAPPKSQIVTTGDVMGATANAVFHPTKPALIFTRQKGIAYESDKQRIFKIDDVTKSLEAHEFYKTEDGKGGWDRSAGTIMWSQDGGAIYAIAEDFARVRLFTLSDHPSTTTLPKLVFKNGGVSDVQWLGEKNLLVSSSSYIDSSLFFTVDPSSAKASNATIGIKLISANLNNGTDFGLSQSQISEAFYKGAGDYQVHTWIIKPSFFKEGETYPLMFYVHGGPQGATEEVWSTRWNMMVWAEQGYIVCAFNPTGSTGFGQSLTDGIQNQWGGRPYEDLVLGFDYVEKNLPYVDVSRAMALGASYGGFMIYWIQGHALGRKFKAMFAHDGSFNTLSQYSSEELWFMQHDFNGTLWDNYDNYARYNPAYYTKEWSTPQLIVHNELDYRLPIAEGLSAFNVLQAKGVPSKFLSFPDENHWVLKPENSLVWHKTALDWLNGYVGLPKYSQPGDEAFRATLMNGPWVY